MKPDIKELSGEALKEWLAGRGEPPYRAAQIRQWLFQKRAVSFAEMSNLPARLRQTLENEFSIGRLEVLRATTSADGTVKYLFGLGDGLSIESVLIPEANRLTLCVSTQVGCGFGCSFCATAQVGLKRNLKSSEIVEQLLEAQRLAGGRRITHVVLMGMGEPLANYPATLAAIRIITDSETGAGISPRRVTLSTVGLVPQMQRLLEETQVNLAVSLHAPEDDLRSQMMPVNRKYPLAALLECCRSLPLPRRRRITFEYVLLAGVNDAPEQAEKLARLLAGLRCKINLIPFNPHPGSPYRRPAPGAIAAFQEVLRRHGYQVNVRQPRGDDVQAACGQLQGEFSRQAYG